MRQEGLFETVPQSRGYILENCVREYINFKVNAEMGHSASISKEQIQAQHEEVKKQISILRLRKLRRELHEAADVEAFLTDMLTRFKSRILSLPTKIAMQTAGESDINRIVQSVTKVLNEALEELSEYDPDEIDGQAAGTFEEMEEEDEEEGEDA